MTDQAEIIEKGYNELHRAERTFKDSMKPYHKRLSDLRRENAQLKAKLQNQEDTNARQRVELKATKCEVIDSYEDAKKYRQIKQLLA